MLYKREICDFNELEYLVWGQAVEILEEISDADKEDELMEHLEQVFEFDTPTLEDINDYISYEWEEIYEELGIGEDEEDDDE